MAAPGPHWWPRQNEYPAQCAALRTKQPCGPDQEKGRRGFLGVDTTNFRPLLQWRLIQKAETQRTYKMKHSLTSGSVAVWGLVHRTSLVSYKVRWTQGQEAGALAALLSSCVT